MPVSTPVLAQSAFQFTRMAGGHPQRQTSLSEAMGNEALAGHTWAFFSPHDDDLCIGAGLLMQAAVQAGVDVQCVIVTDGCLGYCCPQQKADIVDVRREETLRSFELLGIGPRQVTFLNFPDGGLTRFVGRRPAESAREPQVGGFTGLQNAFTHCLRELRPTRVFVPTRMDLHPDHQITHNELMISLFHASGKIWPELGDPVEVPQVHEMAVYCDFPEDPQLEVVGNAASFETKLKSIAAYESQLQIEELVNKLREDGPVEYIRDVRFRLYSPRRYRDLFAMS